MSILTTTEVAAFLGIPSNSQGLGDAISHAEALVAGKLGLSTLELTTYTSETKVLTYNTQQILPEHGPIRTLTAFSYGGDDVLSDVAIRDSWAIRWDDPEPLREFDRVRTFERTKKVVYTYSAGWTNSAGSYPLPSQVAEYVKSLTGLVYQNLLASGVYDTKLGDMTIKMQRETLEKNLAIYDLALARHARPFA